MPWKVVTIAEYQLSELINLCEDEGMNKKQLKEYINEEVYGDYRKSKERLTIIDRVWCKYLSPSTNAVYLIRRKQYVESKGKIGRLFGKYYRILLMRRYCIHVNSNAVIGLGFRLVHPMCISIAECEIGTNFTIYQCCTVGAKSLDCLETPKIGSNVTMYSGSSIIGGIEVGDDVSIGANSLLIKNACEPGVYIGSPAKRKV